MATDYLVLAEFALAFFREWHADCPVLDSQYQDRHVHVSYKSSIGTRPFKADSRRESASEHSGVESWINCFISTYFPDTISLNIWSWLARTIGRHSRGNLDSRSRANFRRFAIAIRSTSRSIRRFKISRIRSLFVIWECAADATYSQRFRLQPSFDPLAYRKNSRNDRKLTCSL